MFQHNFIIWAEIFKVQKHFRMNELHCKTVIWISFDFKLMET